MIRPGEGLELEGRSEHCRRGSQGSAAWGAMEEMDPPGQDPPGQGPLGQGPPGAAADARDALTPLRRV